MIKIKNYLFVPYLTIVLVFFLALGLFAGLVYLFDFAKTEVATYYDAERTYKLEVYTIGSAIAFSPEDCRLVLTEGRRRISKMDFSLSNDGKMVSQDNFDVSWAPKSVSITVNGEEQDDVTYILYFDGRQDIREHGTKK